MNREITIKNLMLIVSLTALSQTHSLSLLPGFSLSSLLPSQLFIHNEESDETSLNTPIITSASIGLAAAAILAFKKATILDIDGVDVFFGMLEKLTGMHTDDFLTALSTLCVATSASSLYTDDVTLPSRLVNSSVGFFLLSQLCYPGEMAPDGCYSAVIRAIGFNGLLKLLQGDDADENDSEALITNVKRSIARRHQ